MNNPPVRYPLAIFDFDGTLADSFPFFIANFNRIADRHRFSRIREEEIEALRGCGARELMARLGIPFWKLPLIARSFITLMKDNQAAISLFDGVPSALSCLARRDVTLALVSSNSHANVTGILGHHCRHFRYVDCGASVFGKAARLRKILRTAGVPPGQAIYIGDQPTDCEAAHAADMAFGLVSWGYGSAHAFRGFRPQAHFDQVKDLCRIAG
ncbi:HAD hydrolase-like protein [Noviherbaspirillum aridicola]|uniref:Phosphoglycolate phosphatase n=1 Tax=Noviherbaspirillum aridicola TaxID=2849687 RepID=A0ABQ4Q860_9BURK|nr:HAD hydrolase-like protein [Noviherbaspirillum aridicola]GIZ53373.1 phosphoglycolate phosphatase [Noviherbaspirillum aridicola]